MEVSGIHGLWFVCFPNAAAPRSVCLFPDRVYIHLYPKESPGLKGLLSLCLEITLFTILCMWGMALSFPLGPPKEVKALWSKDTRGLQLLIWGKQQNRSRHPIPSVPPLTVCSEAQRQVRSPATRRQCPGATQLWGGETVGWWTITRAGREQCGLYLDTTW